VKSVATTSSATDIGFHSLKPTFQADDIQRVAYTLQAPAPGPMALSQRPVQPDVLGYAQKKQAVSVVDADEGCLPNICSV
jgi:hypothetical protein